MKKPIQHMIVLLFTSLYILWGCSTLQTIKNNIFDDKIQQKEIAENQQKIELLLAKIILRLEEIEHQHSQIQAKITILQKGLMLGIVPEELKNDTEKTLNKLITNNNPVQNTSNSIESTLNTKQQKDNIDPKTNQTAFIQKLSEAEALFRAGKYGQAIVAYAALEKEYPQETQDGSTQYWSALSWFELKEYQTALEKFQTFITKYPQNSWIPNAKVYVAKAKIKLGLMNEAINELRSIIQDYPNSEVSDIAKMELKNMEYNL